MYIRNFWTVFSEEPREANTKGNLSGHFGTVMMVLIMSVAAVAIWCFSRCVFEGICQAGRANSNDSDCGE